MHKVNITNKQDFTEEIRDRFIGEIFSVIF